MFNCYIWLDLPTVFDVVYMMESCIYLGVLIYGRYSVHTGSLQESSVDSGGIGCVDEVGRELIADYVTDALCELVRDGTPVSETTILSCNSI